MRRRLLVWLGLDALLVLALARRGRPEANAHPTARHGDPDWY